MTSEINAAMVDHLSNEVARLEAENERLSKALESPTYVTVTPPISPPAGAVVPTMAEQSVIAALNNISGSLNMILHELRNKP